MALNLILVSRSTFGQSHSQIISPHPLSADHLSADDSRFRVTKIELRKAIQSALEKVDEFRFIKGEAQKLGIKVYLFGGTASAFAHYVRWDERRKKGDSRYQANRFDYTYINIYRSTQDLDLVIDGPTDTIRLLESAILNQYPYLQGSKGQKHAWEIRSLREDVGDKLALLNNPDFINQHTDSNSVGLIEITDPVHSSERIRDLRDWNNLDNSGYLNDITEGKIHYYFSPYHESTHFYKQGRNPPILSVIRYFIKVFQLDLTSRPEDRQTLLRIIRDFDPKSIESNSYLPKWLSENAPKLLQNAIDVEVAMNVLEETGLRSKLSQIGDPNVIGSLSWWMNKQPLLSKPVARGSGRTAAKLGIEIIAHETTSFLVFEAITRSHKGLPNVFISREGSPGESGIHGDGFYAMIGQRSGFRGTGLTIRFSLNPEAREGKDADFTIKDEIIIVHNRNAIKVIAENISMNLIEYYNWLAAAANLSKDDLGIFQRLRLAMRPHFLNPNEEERHFLGQLTKQQLFTLFAKDPSIESKLLLLNATLERLHKLGEFIDFFEEVLLWQRKASETDALRLAQALESKRPFIISKVLQDQSPTSEIRRAFELGIFKNHEWLYLEHQRQELYSTEEILYFLDHWFKFTKEGVSNRNTKKQLAEIGKLFFAQSPTTEQTATFMKSFPFIEGAMALVVRKPDHPIVVAQVLAHGFSAQKGDRLGLNVWTSKHYRFFATEPNEQEIIQTAQLLRHPRVHLDLLEYASSKLRFLRKEDLSSFLGALTNPYQISPQERQEWNRHCHSLTSKLLERNPSFSELEQIMVNEALGSENIDRLIGFAFSKIQSANDLTHLMNRFSDPERRIQEVTKLKDKISQYRISQDALDSITKSIKFEPKLTLLILKRFIAVSPANFDAVFDFFGGTVRGSSFLTLPDAEEIWIKTFNQYLATLRKFDDLLKIKKSIPTAKAYELFLYEALKRSSNTIEFHNTLQKDNHRMVENLEEAERRQFMLVNDRLIPQITKSKLSLFIGTDGLANLKDLQAIVSHLSTTSSIIEVMDLFFNNGLKVESYFVPHDVSVNFTNASWDLRLPSPPANAQDLQDVWILYYLFKHESVTAPKHFVNYFANRHLLSMLILGFSDKSPTRLRLDSELELALYRYYLLRTIEQLVALTQRDPIKRTKVPENVSHLRRLVTKEEDWAQNPKLEELVRAIDRKYQNLPTQLNQSHDDKVTRVIGLLTRSKNRTDGLLELKNDIIDSKQVLDGLLSTRNELRQRFEKLSGISSVNRCLETISKVEDSD